MEINYLNDGKEKCMSHEMWVDVDSDELQGEAV